jgi:hypothetical protein
VARTSDCAPDPHLCGFPDATNTGAPPGTALIAVPQAITSPTADTGSGWFYDRAAQVIDVNRNGAIVKDVATDAPIVVNAARNVTIENVRVIVADPNGFGIWLTHTRNATVAHSIVAGANKSSARLLAAIKDVYGDASGTRVLSDNLYNSSTGVQMDSGLIQDTYIHDLGYISGDHLNGTTSNGSDGTLLTIEHNTVFNSYSQTDAISLFEDFGRQYNRVIDDNLLAGGGYCIYGGQNPGGPPISDVRITDNRFSTLYHPRCGVYGPVAAFTTTGVGNVFRGNVWDVSGRPVSS